MSYCNNIISVRKASNSSLERHHKLINYLNESLRATRQRPNRSIHGFISRYGLRSHQRDRWTPIWHHQNQNADLDVLLGQTKYPWNVSEKHPGKRRRARLVQRSFSNRHRNHGSERRRHVHIRAGLRFRREQSQTARRGPSHGWPAKADHRWRLLRRVRQINSRVPIWIRQSQANDWASVEICGRIQRLDHVSA